MTARPYVAFACAHLTDDRLFAPQVGALAASHDCGCFAWREHASFGAMAEALLAGTPSRFTLIGLSLGGYLAFEVMRRQPERVERLVLMGTTAQPDDETGRTVRFADLARVENGGIDALLPELPARWLHPEHAQQAEFVDLMLAMGRSIGAVGQRNQQQAMLDRPDSRPVLPNIRVPTLVVCGREDKVRPVSQHEEIARLIPGARLEVIEHSGHFTTLEQPAKVSRLLSDWLRETSAR
jgi:pimeloyl-ACP methyl ester carboxylesterase